ncbi:LysR family transcriptional regulator [Marimonas lutisalis]|uniref:LysR family transcriptional regulator n=1 Tax=Marimonas lutisalis TaxID=2545756 RepID=UPI0010F6157C|nr:LysR family transcriptional regulator [Marimonas lutisalis]
MKNGFRDWSDVRVFLAVLRAGSTLAASRQLGMAQPTVARRIDALEHSLGLQLVERDTRGSRPTAEALELLPLAEALEASAEAFSEKAENLKSERSRVIRITGVQDVFNSSLSAILRAFSEKHKNVRFEFIPSSRHLDLMAGEADVALRIANKLEDQDLICRKVVSIPASLFASSGYEAKHGLPRDETELEGHKFIVYKGENVPHAINTWILDRITPDQIAMECADMRSMEAAIHMDLGVAGLPTRYKFSEEGFVECFQLPRDTTSYGWLVASPAAYRRKEVKSFFTFAVPRYRAYYLETEETNS